MRPHALTHSATAFQESAGSAYFTHRPDPRFFLPIRHGLLRLKLRAAHSADSSINFSRLAFKAAFRKPLLTKSE
jgi:hypothetical protein